MANTLHTFNTGRFYSVHGQRIAWTVLSTGNVAMLDVDRGIDYVLNLTGLVSVVGADDITSRDVLSAYDAIALAPFNADELREAKEQELALRAAASLCPRVKASGNGY